ncbi:MAG: caspase family protein [Nitratireductor sp.]|nr:caspase family protein [Nitratireductor sp.]
MESIFSRVLIACCAAVSLALFSSPSLAEKRVALVIGNSAYLNANPISNPENDANDMAAALKKLGFEVVVGTDLNNRSMRDTVREFGNLLRGADVAMLYYAGHALQVGGTNYLAPVDARLEFESDLEFETISLSFIQRQMEREAKTLLIFLDACRDNPLTRSFKTASRSQGAGKGLAEEKLASSGILIAFATNPDNVALDGKGRNSPFTKALLDNIERPGVEISTLMTDVRVQVSRDTGGQQTPWINSGLLGRFYFNPETDKSAETKNADDKPVETQTAVTQILKEIAASSGQTRSAADRQTEIAFWESIKDAKDIRFFEAYLEQFPEGAFVGLAQLKIMLLGAKTGQATLETPAKAEVSKPVAPVAEEKVVARAKPVEPAKVAEPQRLAALEPKPEKVELPSASVSIETPETTKADNSPAEPSPQLLGDLQRELNRLGCEAGKVDGKWGSRSQSALEGFAKETGLKLASVEPTSEMLGKLKEATGRVCPLVCGRGFEISGDSCERIKSAKPEKKQTIVKSRSKARKKVSTAQTTNKSTSQRKKVFRQTDQGNRHMPFGIDSDGAQM